MQARSRSRPGQAPSLSPAWGSQITPGPAKLVTRADATTGLSFYNQAAAGSQTVFTAENASFIIFYDEATAGFGTFIIEGTEYFLGGTSELRFYDNSTAGNGIFINTGGSGSDTDGGFTWFLGDSTAANGTFANKAATDPSAYTGGDTFFSDSSTAADGIFTNEGGAASFEDGGSTSFYDSSAAGNATITCNGGEVAGAGPGEVYFFGTASAGSATLIAKGGLRGGDGGIITFWDTSDGDEARVELFGNGTLDLANLTSPGLTVGSLEGDGIVLLDTHSITIGTNNLSTTFSGVISGTGSFTKTEAGILALSGASSYTGGTTIEAGRLLVENKSGSATGTGPVQVNAGVLGGRGIISGAVTLGTGGGVGGYLAPGKNKSRPGTLTVQGNITFNSDAIYACDLNSNRATADKVLANGVAIDAAAFFSLADSGAATLAPGTVFTVIDNTAATPIAGTFSNLADGSAVTVGNNTFQANYEGGDGNDLSLTVVP